MLRLVGIRNGRAIYHYYTNLNAAKTISTDKLQPEGATVLNLTGYGINVGIWDAGGVFDLHPEFGQKVVIGDNPYQQYAIHSTHVVGTIGAAGINDLARGMGTQIMIYSHDSALDLAEVPSAILESGIILSNHSYTDPAGWSYAYGIYGWHGNTTIDRVRDYEFGYYDSKAYGIDEIIYNNQEVIPYLWVNSAGNDRDDTMPPEDYGGAYGYLGYHRHFEPSQSELDGCVECDYDCITFDLFPDVPRTVCNDENHENDCTNGYNCIPAQATAKNIITVGSVEDLPEGYTNSSDVILSSFSSAGPTSDGRIKPDIVANGEHLLSTKYDASFNPTYGYGTGTSMSTPSVTSSLALLQELHFNLFGEYLNSAELKAVVIHTADEAGNVGPDYHFGWGLMNTKSAADLILLDEIADNTIQTLSYSGIPIELVVEHSSGPLKVTIVWTDPPGPVHDPYIDYGTSVWTEPVLVNDLDLTIISEDGPTTYYPYSLDPLNPSAPAVTTTKNYVDNVEQIRIENAPSGNYTVRIDHEGTITNVSQDFALILTEWPIIFGCTDATAYNYDPDATNDNGSCYGQKGDINLDECVNVIDITLLVDLILQGTTYDGDIYEHWAANLILAVPPDDEVLNTLDLTALADFIISSPTCSGAQRILTNSFINISDMPIILRSDGSQIEINMINQEDVRAAHLEFLFPEVEVLDVALNIDYNYMTLNWSMRGDTLAVVFYGAEGQSIPQGNHSLGNITIDQSLGRIETTRPEYFWGEYVDSELELYSFEYNDHIDSRDLIPYEYKLYTPYPNPFNSMVAIKYDLPVDSYIDITIYNLQGRVVNKMITGNQEAGSYQLLWSGKGASSGIYFVKLTTNSHQFIQKLMLLK